MIEQIAIVALLAWLAQLALAYRQARVFYKRIGELKKFGRCATGLSGGRYGGRTYVALVAHPEKRTIVKAEQLRGWTVFATLKPVPELEGRFLEELLATEVPTIENVPQKVVEAARSAAEAIKTSLDKEKASVTA